MKSLPEWFLFHLIACPYCKYSNILNNKRNNTSFSVHNITIWIILRNSDCCHIGLLFVIRNTDHTTTNYLKAFIAGEKALSSTEVMHRYQISSTTSISRSKATLIKNNILENKAGEISFQDPIYAY